MWRLTSAGITLASVVIWGWMRSWCATRRSAWLSTSPLSARHEVRRAAGRLELVAVDRVGVGFGDDADARPTRVAEHRRARRGAATRQPQQLVAGDAPRATPACCRRARRSRRPPCTRTTARRRRRAPNRTGRSGPAHARRARLHRRVGRVEPVSTHEHVDAGRVAAAHFEPIERRERLLDREVGGQRALAGVAPGELGRPRGRCAADRCEPPTARRAGRSSRRRDARVRPAGRSSTSSSRRRRRRRRRADRGGR